ncbi:RCC1-like domain-containing protein [Leptospira stimsonii]|uniref:RCC1-like domain-containing protein n=1 Tax=Leptospira stimsonii TaxID=2202203 RepID=UPI001FEECF8D|nr:RCC1 domain-containing protein [Leptospira stimsonii]
MLRYKTQRGCGSLGFLKDGDVYTWGRNTYGQLRNGSFDRRRNIQKTELDFKPQRHGFHIVKIRMEGESPEFDPSEFRRIFRGFRNHVPSFSR